MAASPRSPVTPREYATLAAFRHALVRFLGFSEAAASAAGLTPRQYHALLALEGRGGRLRVGELAEQLQIHHHSAVGLVDRLESLGLVARRTDPADRRRVQVVPTAAGRRRLGKLAAAHRDELRTLARPLRDLLGRLAAPAPSARRSLRRRT